MNYTRDDHPQFGCGPEEPVEKTGEDTNVRQAEPEVPSGSANETTEVAPVPRARGSFQGPTRAGRGRLDSREHHRLRTTLDYTDCPRILLPLDLRDELEDGFILADDARREQRNARTKEALEERARWEDIQNRENGRSTPPSSTDKPTETGDGRKARGGKKQGDEEKGEEQGEKAPDSSDGKPSRRARRGGIITSLLSPAGFCEQVAELPPRKRNAVYSPDAIRKLEKGAASADSDVHKRNAQLFAQLSPKGALRRVGLTRRIDDVLALQLSHPHFSEVIQFVADRIALQKASRRPVGIPPMMLFGPPGVGKTHFCEALAAILHVPVRRHPMDQAETSSALLGSEQTWGNTRYGLVFEMLALGDYANPVVILDELDKACRGQSSGGNMQSPTAVLHSLLEPVSALRVRDISVDIELDASLITWIATANYPWLIPPTLRSRLKEFLIRMPTAEQALLVASSVVAQAIRDSGAAWREPPDRRFIAAVAHLSAREIYQATATAAASAVRRGGQGAAKVELSDLPREVLMADEDSAAPQAFLH
jgi:hypothetical protein